MVNKMCSGCKEIKSLDEFSLHPQAKDGRNPKCKTCKNKQARDYHAANKEKVKDQRKKNGKRDWRRSYYDITRAEFEKIVEDQKGLCALGHDPRGLLVVDHCHSTSKFRGAICSDCNIALGFMRDSPDRLRKAAEYLERFMNDKPEVTPEDLEKYGDGAIRHLEDLKPGESMPWAHAVKIEKFAQEELRDL